MGRWIGGIGEKVPNNLRKKEVAWAVGSRIRIGQNLVEVKKQDLRK